VLVPVVWDREPAGAALAASLLNMENTRCRRCGLFAQPNCRILKIGKAGNRYAGEMAITDTGTCSIPIPTYRREGCRGWSVTPHSIPADRRRDKPLSRAGGRVLGHDPHSKPNQPHRSTGSAGEGRSWLHGTTLMAHSVHHFCARLSIVEPTYSSVSAIESASDTSP
jgi:hypothetical protein